MNDTFQIYLISDSTGETLDRIFLALKAQFKNIDYKTLENLGIASGFSKIMGYFNFTSFRNCLVHDKVK